MRPLIVTIVLAFVAPQVFSAEKNEDKAREAAVAFLKAVKAKDVDAVLKVSAAPFVYQDGEKAAVLKDEAALKAWVKERLDGLKEADKVPTKVEKIVPFAELKGEIKDADERKKVEEIVGNDGFVAIVSDGGEMIGILIRVKDGKATVVGVTD